MIESSTEPEWLSVAQASRALGISETAVRKRIQVGSLPARDHQGRKEVRIEVGNRNEGGLQPPALLRFDDARVEIARMTVELAHLRTRLAETQRDRDRWHQLALEAREDARGAEAARMAIERELRLLLSQP